jgi:hypothetical protein
MEIYAPASTSTSTAPAPPARSHTPHHLGQRRRHHSLGDDQVARHIRRAEIQGRHLAAGRIPQSCIDTGRICAEAILHAAWLIQVEREAAQERDTNWLQQQAREVSQ